MIMLWGQDGVPISAEERQHAQVMLPGLQARLRAELLAEGLDPDANAAAEDDSLLDLEAIPETG
jgi:hypothetical protein